MAFFKKPAKDGPGRSAGPDVIDRAFADRYPILSEFLSLGLWEDGSVRETGTMFMFIQAGAWKMMLKDRATGFISFWTADSLEEMFMAVESALEHDRVDWKRDRKPAGRGR